MRSRGAELKKAFLPCFGGGVKGLSDRGTPLGIGLSVMNQVAVKSVLNNHHTNTNGSAVRFDYRQRSVVRKYLVSDYGKIKHLEHCRLKFSVQKLVPSN